MKYLKSICEFRDGQIIESVDDLDLNANEIDMIEEGTESEDKEETKSKRIVRYGTSVK